MAKDTLGQSGETDPRGVSERPGAHTVAASLYDVNASDPQSDLIDRSALAEEDVTQLTRLMNAMAKMRRAEQELSRASQEFMQLSETEMRAVHYLIVAANQGKVATPGALAKHLSITSASTTKLLDRLERGEHITRGPHPTDRRSLSITVTERTHSVARDTVGRAHAERFTVAAALNASEREVVIGFLDSVADRMSAGLEHWAAAESPA